MEECRLLDYGIVLGSSESALMCAHMRETERRAPPPARPGRAHGRWNAIGERQYIDDKTFAILKTDSNHTLRQAKIFRRRSLLGTVPTVLTSGRSSAKNIPIGRLVMYNPSDTEIRIVYCNPRPQVDYRRETVSTR